MIGATVIAAVETTGRLITIASQSTAAMMSPWAKSERIVVPRLRLAICWSRSRNMGTLRPSFFAGGRINSAGDFGRAVGEGLSSDSKASDDRL